jgi:hypothetical protein
MFFSIYHHYGPYGQIDVVRIIVFRACPFSKFECPTHVISAKGFVSEVIISALSLLRGSTS